MKQPVTISREFGSGGRQIGEKLAKVLEIPFYDRTLIDLVAQKSGYPLDFVPKMISASPKACCFRSRLPAACPPGSMAARPSPTVIRYFRRKQGDS